jgi:hypothetical protein
VTDKVAHVLAIRIGTSRWLTGHPYSASICEIATGGRPTGWQIPLAGPMDGGPYYLVDVYSGVES